MKKIILLATMTMVASNAMAMSRHESQSLTCSSIHEKIAEEGSIVLSYPSHRDPNFSMYNRYVANSMSCLGQGSMTSTTVPTSDDPNCKVRMCNPVTGKGPNKNH
jgi:hypothetical protein